MKSEKPTDKDWLEVPWDVMANILSRLGVEDILENAQKVCTTWYKICKDPTMWRVINMQFCPRKNAMIKMCMHAVDRSQGQLVDVSIGDYGSNELLMYIADRSCQLKRLQISDNYVRMYESLFKALEKFPLLEELSLYSPQPLKVAIEFATRYCPLLKTLKVKQRFFTIEDFDRDRAPLAIGENLAELRHLELNNCIIFDVRLEAILDGCRHLESLDLRNCWIIFLEDEIREMLSKEIKYLRLPDNPLKDYYPYVLEDALVDFDDPYGDYEIVEDLDIVLDKLFVGNNLQVLGLRNLIKR